MHYLFSAKQLTKQADLAPNSLKIAVMFIFGSSANKFVVDCPSLTFSKTRIILIFGKGEGRGPL